MKKVIWFIFIVVFVVLISGCGGVMVVKVTKDNKDIEGLRFYRPAPYLVISKEPAKDNALSYQIVYLPNTNEEYAIQTRTGIGTVENKYVLADGWKLTEYNDKRDPKIIEGITWLTDLITPADKKGTEDGKIRPVNTPGLYALEFDETGMIKGAKQILKF